MPSELYTFGQTTGDAPRVIELRLPLQLDVLTFDDLNTALLDHVQANGGNYIIDLSGTDYVGSAVLGLLVNIRSRIKRAGGQLVLCSLSPRILEIFRVGSLESLFTIAPTREAAVGKLKK